MGFFSPKKRESKQKEENEEEFEYGECGSTYETKREAINCCTENKETSYTDYCYEKGNVLIFDIEEFYDTLEADCSDLQIELADAINKILSKGFELKINTDFSNSGNQGELIFIKKAEMK